MTSVVRLVLQTALEVEMADHLGYQRRHVAGRGRDGVEAGGERRARAEDAGDVVADVTTPSNCFLSVGGFDRVEVRHPNLVARVQAITTELSDPRSLRT